MILWLRLAAWVTHCYAIPRTYEVWIGCLYQCVPDPGERRLEWRELKLECDGSVMVHISKRSRSSRLCGYLPSGV